MKKLYKQPETMIVEVKGSQLMDAPISFYDNGEGAVNPINDNADSEGLSRQHDIWDD